MSDLVAFLRARLDEDEAELRESIVSGGGDYHACSDKGLHLDVERAEREVGAKRRIVDLHGPWHICWTHTEWEHAGERHDHAAGGDMPPCDTLRLLALPYSDHPDYRPEWRL